MARVTVEWRAADLEQKVKKKKSERTKGGLCTVSDTAGTRVLTGRRDKEWGTGPSMFMGVPITEEVSWMTDSPV